MAMKIKGAFAPATIVKKKNLKVDTVREVIHLQSHPQKDYILHALARSMGRVEPRRYNNAYPLRMLVPALGQIKKHLDEEFSEILDPEIETIIVDYGTTVEKEFQQKLAEGRVEFDDLMYLFKPDTKVYGEIYGHLVGGIVHTAEYVTPFFGPSYFLLRIKVIHNIRGELEESELSLAQMSFKGFKDISDLSVQILNETAEQKLRARGEQFVKFTQGSVYANYSGHITRSSYWAQQRYRADGRVMVDVMTFKRVDASQMDSEENRSGLEDEDRYNRVSQMAAGSAIKYQIEDSDLWRTYPFVYGFSFKAKAWGRLDVDKLSEIKWASDAFDKLVLDEDKKALVRSLVEYHGDSFTDLIDGKGGGCIFLLHGPPGQGKTLTAEAVAEYLERPLYSISVGELGTEPDELESKLRSILDVATVWNAVILLDEADIFLEARDEHDIMRNAMVGVFLRLLEYHQGVLFLTTNRVKEIDPAFYSRISVALRFEDGGVAKRRKIWVNLLSAAKIIGMDDDDIDILATYDLNGRQIKNVIKLTQTLARASNFTPDLKQFKSVIQLTTDFSL